jgi:hypothetical protein
MGTALFSGGRTESFNVLSGTPADYTANSSRWDTTYSDAALVLNGGVVSHLFYDSTMTATTVTSGHTLYWHAYLSVSAFNAANFFVLYDSSGNPWLRIRLQQDTNNLYLEANTGTSGSPTWTQLGATLTLANGNYAFDLSVALDTTSGHTATIYIDNNATTTTGTWTQTAFMNAAEVRLSSGGTNAPPFVSQVMAVEDASTISGHVYTCRATGAGTYSEWTGTYTDVNEPGDNDSTNNYVSFSGAKQSYPMGDVTVPTGYNIPSVFYWLRGKNDGGIPGNIRKLMVSGGVEYDGAANLPGISVGYSSLGSRYDADPNTTAPWTETTWNAVELGYLSEA